MRSQPARTQASKPRWARRRAHRVRPTATPRRSPPSTARPACAYPAMPPPAVPAASVLASRVTTLGARKRPAGRPCTDRWHACTCPVCSGTVQACAVGSFKATSGNAGCTMCPALTTTATAASVSKLQCLCLPGATGSNGGACRRTFCAARTCACRSHAHSTAVPYDRSLYSLSCRAIQGRPWPRQLRLLPCQRHNHVRWRHQREQLHVPRRLCGPRRRAMSRYSPVT